MTVSPSPVVVRARSLVALVFALNGLCFATWVSRIPGVRSELSLGNSGLGWLLLALACGSVIALPSSGSLIHRFGTATVTRTGAVAAMVGLCVVPTGVHLGSVEVCALGLFCYGIGTGVWDVAMNVEGASVEQALGRAIMPRFHAAFSLGTVSGAGLGALALAIRVPIAWHLGGVVVIAAVATWTASMFYLDTPDEGEGPPTGAGWAAWREPKTLLIGLLVLVFALTEGTANDWLAVALIDGYHLDHYVGVMGYAAFVVAMTIARTAGTVVLDRHGRTRVLWSTMVAAFLGVLLVVFGSHPALVVLGIVMWGCGAALGFPVGMSAAADDPVHSAPRVSVVATIGYAAFLGGPPLLAALAESVGALDALLILAVILIPAAALVPAAREPERSSPGP